MDPRFLNLFMFSDDAQLTADWYMDNHLDETVRFFQVVISHAIRHRLLGLTGTSVTKLRKTLYKTKGHEQHPLTAWASLHVGNLAYLINVMGRLAHRVDQRDHEERRDRGSRAYVLGARDLQTAFERFKRNSMSGSACDIEWWFEERIARRLFGGPLSIATLVNQLSLFQTQNLLGETTPMSDICARHAHLAYRMYYMRLIDETGTVPVYQTRPRPVWLPAGLLASMLMGMYPHGAAFYDFNNATPAETIYVGRRDAPLGGGVVKTIKKKDVPRSSEQCPRVWTMALARVGADL